MSTEQKYTELDLHINRYHITRSVKNDLLIHVKRSRKIAPVTGFLLFGGMAAFFGFITVHTYLKEGYHFMMIVMSFFCLFMTVLSVMILVGSYSTRRSYHFRTNELIITNAFGFKKYVDRQDVKSVFISKTLFADQGKSPDNYTYHITLRIPSLKSRELSLFDIEGRDTISYIIGMMDEKGMSIAGNESLQIASVIADHWQMPVSI